MKTNAFSPTKMLLFEPHPLKQLDQLPAPPIQVPFRLVKILQFGQDARKLTR